MIDTFLKKALLLHAEIASMAAEKVQEVAEKFVEKGTMHDADAKKFVEEVKEKLTSKEKELEDYLDKASKFIQDFKIPGVAKPCCSEDDLDGQIREMEKKIEELKMKKEMEDKAKE